MTQLHYLDHFLATDNTLNSNSYTTNNSLSYPSQQAIGDNDVTSTFYSHEQQYVSSLTNRQTQYGQQFMSQSQTSHHMTVNPPQTHNFEARFNNLTRPSEQFDYANCPFT